MELITKEPTSTGDAPFKLIRIERGNMTYSTDPLARRLSGAGLEQINRGVV